MNVRAIIVGVLALSLAGLAVVLTRSWLQSSQQPTQTVAQPAGPDIMLAKANLPRGTIITAESIEYIMWNGPTPNPAYITRDSENAKSVIGQTVRYDMVAGEPILMAKLAQPGEEGPLGIALTPGMRAMALGVNRTSGLSGLPKPGDHVDIIYISPVTDVDGRSRNVARTVLTGARVLGVDTRVTDEAVASDNPKTVTVEVTPADAQRLALMR